MLNSVLNYLKELKRKLREKERERRNSHMTQADTTVPPKCDVLQQLLLLLLSPIDLGQGGATANAS